MDTASALMVVPSTTFPISGHVLFEIPASSATTITVKRRLERNTFLTFLSFLHFLKVTLNAHCPQLKIDSLYNVCTIHGFVFYSLLRPQTFVLTFRKSPKTFFLPAIKFRNNTLLMTIAHSSSLKIRPTSERRVQSHTQTQHND
jgi:hypothetical protein